MTVQSMSNWNRINFFETKEFDSPDQPGSGHENMQMSFVRTLDSIRETVGFPFVINSGYRTEEHNDEVGGDGNLEAYTTSGGTTAELAVE